MSIKILLSDSLIRRVTQRHLANILIHMIQIRLVLGHLMQRHGVFFIEIVLAVGNVILDFLDVLSAQFATILGYPRVDDLVVDIFLVVLLCWV